MLQLRTGANAGSFFGTTRCGRPTARHYTVTCPPPSPASRPLSPRPPRSTSLAGTVPYHASYLLIHARDPPYEWPPAFTQHVYLDIKRRLKEYHGLVNFCWLGEHHDPAKGRSEDTFSATLWKKSNSLEVCHRIEIPLISTTNVGTVVESLHRDLSSPPECEEYVASSGPYFYICTHSNRDCRCGVRGGELLRDLRKELDGRGMLFDPDGKSRVGELGHVGGHKNAPNLLVFPHGDWYGNLESKDLPGLIDHYVRSLEEVPIPPSLLTGPNRFQWRGRLGMTKKEQSDAIHGVEWGVTDLLGFSGLLL